MTSQRIRGLTIVDTSSKISPAIGVDFSYRGCAVVDILDSAVEEQGCPKWMQFNNGPEFVSRDLHFWAYVKRFVLDFSRPGKPTDIAYIETLNSCAAARVAPSSRSACPRLVF